MSKYPICKDCYYNNRSPEICEICDNGSEYEPELGGDTEFVSGGGSKKVKIHRKQKDFA